MCVGVCTGRRGGSRSRSARGSAGGATRGGRRRYDDWTTDHSSSFIEIANSARSFRQNSKKKPDSTRPPFFRAPIFRPSPARSRVRPSTPHRRHPPLTPHYRTSPSPAGTPYHTGPTGDAAHPHFHPSSPDHSSPHRGYPQNLPHSLPALPATCCGGYAGPATKGSDPGFSRAREGGGDDGRVRRARAGYAVARFCR